jgi:hypothetical protein
MQLPNPEDDANKYKRWQPLRPSVVIKELKTNEVILHTVMTALKIAKSS